MRLPGRGAGRRSSGGGGPVDWLIVGLGNPGSEYTGTRHNIGFEVANELAKRWGLPKAKAKYRGLLSEGRAGAGLGLAGAGEAGAQVIEGRAGADALLAAGVPARSPRVAILLPQTYMNDAGQSVGPARGAFEVPLERVLVIHDEIDLPFGEIRTRTGGGLAGHNGLKSLRQALGSPEFARVRIGVGRPPTTDPNRVAAYVLSRFPEPREEVGRLIENAADAAERVVAGGDGSDS